MKIIIPEYCVINANVICIVYKSYISFVEGLAGQLSTELGQLKGIIVIAYHTIRRIEKKIMAVKKGFSPINVQYVFAGDIQRQEHRYRINIQLIDTKSNEQVWSKVFERDLSPANFFDIQDYIVGQIIPDFKDLCKSLRLATGKTVAWGVLTSINNSNGVVNKEIKKSISAR